MKDKNGRKIKVGDTVKHPHFNYTFKIIEFRRDERYGNLNAVGKSHLGEIGFGDSKKLEVIGND